MQHTSRLLWMLPGKTASHGLNSVLNGVIVVVPNIRLLLKEKLIQLAE